MHYCEEAAINLLPTLRALVARELKEKHGLTQQEIAKLLDITQPAISQYLKSTRGKYVKKIEKNKEIMKIIEELAMKIKNHGIKKSEISKKFCEICKLYCSKENCLTSL